MSLFGSICLQGCLSIDVEVQKCLHIGNFHLQSLEILPMNLPWLIISRLVCECCMYTYIALKNPFHAYFFYDILPHKEISKLTKETAKLTTEAAKLTIETLNKS